MLQIVPLAFESFNSPNGGYIMHCVVFAYAGPSGV